ncbi:hypothetical protein [Jeotgalibaca caeni]|uniref:hypothetical protein n=1 Tax=Jeotgalibaca caeni TaxID=3028623 RepID=UPI00237EA3F7|nr:hypothetical protein [Jeotgalibaca caeni]MDE1550020.1 hypothetical protein [Jeotgalibaca caeni]
MAIIVSDIIINGKHASIARSLIDNDLYQNGAELFVEAALLGIYYGRQGEVDATTQDRLQVSRTYFDRRTQLENILFIFLQHEKVYQRRALSAAEVFNINENTLELKPLVEELKAHALFGIEKLGERYSKLLIKVKPENVVDVLLDQEKISPEEIATKVTEDEKHFVKPQLDEEIEAIING